MDLFQTSRGLKGYKFQDRYDEKCSIQKSSLASEPAIWLGVEDAHPQILASDAYKVGMQSSANVGWIPYPIPDVVNLNTQMHLTQSQVRDLLPLLQKFVETGEL
jgi:hypothetical protein